MTVIEDINEAVSDKATGHADNLTKINLKIFFR